MQLITIYNCLFVVLMQFLFFVFKLNDTLETCKYDTIVTTKMDGILQVKKVQCDNFDIKYSKKKERKIARGFCQIQIGAQG